MDTYSFDDQSNKDVNSSITRNVKAVAQDSQYDVSLIKRKYDSVNLLWPYGHMMLIGAARTYFKSRKSAHQRVQRGKQQSTSKAARRRQRKHNVSFKALLGLLYNYRLLYTESTCKAEGFKSVKVDRC